MYSLTFICFIALVPTIICTKDRSNILTLTTWNIGLEEQLSLERAPVIIDSIRKQQPDILCLQEAWGGPQLLRKIYQSVKDIYPHFEVVDDEMREYISSKTLPTKAYSPACIASDITNAQICIAQHCSGNTGPTLLLCVINQCAPSFIALYTQPKCWACIFDRFITYNDPYGMNYCGAVNFPQLISTSSGIVPNSTEAPWGHSVGLMILSKVQYSLKKLKAGVYSEYFIAPRGYIIVGYEEKNLVIANTHVATVDTPIPHVAKGTLLNNQYDTWGDENLGQVKELESIVWGYVRSHKRRYTNAIMAGDFNMGIDNFEHSVTALQADSWNYLHSLTDKDGVTRSWYDDYTERHSACTACKYNRVVTTNNRIYDHIFTHGPLFSPSTLFTRRVFDELTTVKAANGTTIITNLSDHYGVELISVFPCSFRD